MIPLGGRADPVNEAGIKWYSDLIDGLLERGIVPFVVRALLPCADSAVLIRRGLSSSETYPTPHAEPASMHANARLI